MANLEGNRVHTLLRVSGKKQVDFDERKEADIPMQRTECHKFAEKMGWEIVFEEQETGVSGYLKTAAERDKLQLIKERALNKEFDILLVFMFDRLGRIASETPFVVEWFCEHGIRVFSAKEGERSFENHDARLINYLTFWQGEGESRKTSMRTSTRLRQLAEEGNWTGGTTPYGYTLVGSGKTKKRNQEVLKLQIVDHQAEVVRKMYDLFITSGYGPQRIATYLIGEGIMDGKGKPWHPATIRGILRNMTYSGVLRCGDARSDVLEDIQIISVETFAKAQKQIAERSKSHAERSTPLRTEGHSLLSGNIFCGHCGSRMSVTTFGKPDYDASGFDKNFRRYKYVCYGRRKKRVKCSGQTSYSMRAVDDVILEIVNKIFASCQSVKKSEVLARCSKEKEKMYKAERSKAKKKLDQVSTELAALKGEIVKTITGESKFTADILTEAITTKQADFDQLQTQRDALDEKLRSFHLEREQLGDQYDDIITWSQLFSKADSATRRMIVSKLINRVAIHSDYSLDIDFNIDVQSLGISEIPKVCFSHSA